jgi:hypothetical protein
MCLKRVPLDRPLRLLGVRTAALCKTEDLKDHIQNSPLAQTKQGQTAINSIASEPQLF